MGFGPGDAEGARTGLVEDDARDVLKLATDLLDQRPACFGVRLILLHQRVDAGRGRSDQLAGLAVEAAALRLIR